MPTTISGDNQITAPLTVGFGKGNETGSAALGLNALAANTTGFDNTAVGGSALSSNTTGTRNVAVGRTSLNTNTTGGSNIAIGAESLRYSTASNNTAIGDSALRANTTASNNTAVGYQAGYSNTTGIITTIGYQAGYSNTTGNYNTFVGNLAGNANTTASETTAVGYQAGRVSTGADNTYLGVYSGYNSTTGTYNCYVGTGAGFNMTTGGKNTILGSYNGNQGGLDIRTSSNHIVLSDGDGNPRAYCTNNASWNFGSTSSVQAGINNVYDGNSYAGLTMQDYTSGSSTHNAVMFYRLNTNTGYIQITGTTTSYGSASDARLKENIVDASSAIDSINSIKVRSFDFISDKSSVKYGFIAQELHQVAPDAVLIGADKEDGSIEIPWGIDASKLVPYLVKAIQELNAKVTALEAQLGTK
jgi:hypothetical protein